MQYLKESSSRTNKCHNLCSEAKFVYVSMELIQQSNKPWSKMYPRPPPDTHTRTLKIGHDAAISCYKHVLGTRK